VVLTVNSADKKARTQGLKSYFPILDWLPRYKTEWLRDDLIAALSVWALLVPQGIAYASIAGVPAQYGLYAALGSLIGYSIPGRIIHDPAECCARRGGHDGYGWRSNPGESP
jgi:hypothetical protein